jgi:hypothetical protein
VKVEDPQTSGEWQDAVNMAEFLLLIDSCKQYGLLSGGPVINAHRCAKMLKLGRARGVFPASNEKLMELYKDLFSL